MPSHSVALTPVQQRVLSHLAEGFSLTQTAEQYGIHRNTIANWRRTNPDFAREFHALQYERALFWRDNLSQSADDAMNALREIMLLKNISASVRLRAALAVIKAATALPAPPPDPPANVVPMPAPHRSEPEPADAVARPQAPYQLAGTQNPQPTPNAPEKVAQICTMPTRTPAPVPASKAHRIGRNELCPCGSNRKYKICCLRAPVAVPKLALAA